MNNKSKSKRIISAIIAILIILAMIFGSVVSAFADDVKILTLGADLNEEQKQLIINYLNINTSNVEVITVTNEDEHFYLDGILPSEKIGTHTYSCCYIEPTNEGGLNIKTVNLNYVNSDMIRNVLITSGINNANVICLAPKEVSGTGAMVGIFKAYDESNVLELDEEKVQLASEELVVTTQLSDSLDDKESATTLIEEVKQEVLINKDNMDTNRILDIIDKCADKMQLNLTEDQKWKIVGIMLKIAQQDYDVNEIRRNYELTKENINKLEEKAVEAKSTLDKVLEFISTTYQKLTGTYEEVKSDERVQNITKNLGIIANTNDSLLGENTVVTGTNGITFQELTEEKEEEQPIEKEETFWDTLIGFFKSLGNKGNKEDKQKEEVKIPNHNFTENKLTDMLTFDNVDNTEEEPEEPVEQESVSDNNMLDYVTYDLQKLDENSTTEN